MRTWSSCTILCQQPYTANLGATPSEQEMILAYRHESSCTAVIITIGTHQKMFTQSVVAANGVGDFRTSQPQPSGWNAECRATWLLTTTSSHQLSPSLSKLGQSSPTFFVSYPSTDPHATLRDPDEHYIFLREWGNADLCGLWTPVSSVHDFHVGMFPHAESSKGTIMVLL